MTSDQPPERTPLPHPELHGAFRPRRTRMVALALAAVTILGMLAFLFAAPARFLLVDRLGFVVLGGLVVYGLWRQASVRAVPSAGGLSVRNLFLGRELEWAEIVSVRLGDRPWVQLDLDDGDTLAVMGIQRSDGDRARTEATRLATLVQLHSPTPDD